MTITVMERGAEQDFTDVVGKALIAAGFIYPCEATDSDISHPGFYHVSDLVMNNPEAAFWQVLGAFEVGYQIGSNHG